MTNHARLTFTTLALMLSACSTIHASPASYPKQILGVWEKGFAPCKFPGNLDSDSRIEVKPKILIHYEESSKPVSVVRISKEPLAWKIQSKLDMGDDYFHDRSQIFILGIDTLTIADKHMTFIYTRCKK